MNTSNPIYYFIHTINLDHFSGAFYFPCVSVNCVIKL